MIPQEPSDSQKETRTTTGPTRSPATRLFALAGSRGTDRPRRKTTKVCACCGKPLADLGHERRQRTDRNRNARLSSSDSPQTLPPDVRLSAISHESSPRRCRRNCCPRACMARALWIHLLVEKFHLQRPTHRTIKQLRLLGLSLAPGTIADGLKRIEPLLTPIYEAIRARHVKSAYFHADETRWQVFAEKAGKIGLSLVVVAVRWRRLGGLCARSQPQSRGAAIALSRRRARRVDGRSL